MEGEFRSTRVMSYVPIDLRAIHEGITIHGAANGTLVTVGFRHDYVIKEHN